MEKLCIFCEHCEWENSLAWGSTWTGEYGARGFGCGKGHFSPYEKGDARVLDGISNIRELFLTAEKCPDYKPPKAELSDAMTDLAEMRDKCGDPHCEYCGTPNVQGQGDGQT